MVRLGPLVTILKEEIYFLGEWQSHLPRWKRMEKEQAGLGRTGGKQEPDFVHISLVMSLRQTYHNNTLLDRSGTEVQKGEKINLGVAI